ncbi:MAG: endonuclease III [Actinomycetaceae bacterium]|nr:endonuclease III [Actinomycetaceae bacterium]
MATRSGACGSEVGERGVSEAEKVAKRLAKLYPDAHCALDYSNAFELLVATVLSAQTTDERVNTITPTLFSKCPTPEALAETSPDELSEIVKPLGFHRRRGKQLQALGEQLETSFRGQVPSRREDLEQLPGVGRKTAHVVLGNAFGKRAITVDTHVGRLARRLGWSRETKPLAVEKDIAALLPDEDWTLLCHRLIEHGRKVCHSKRPQCGSCQLAELCPSAGTLT